MTDQELIKVVQNRINKFSPQFKNFWRLNCQDVDILQQGCFSLLRNKNKINNGIGYINNIIRNEIISYVNRTLMTKAFPRNPTKTYKGRQYKWFKPITTPNLYSKEWVIWPEKSKKETIFYEKQLELCRLYYDNTASYEERKKQKQKIRLKYQQWLASR